MTSGQLAGILRETPEGCTLAVRVQPGAKRTAITGIHADSDHPQLKITLKAPPIEGRANEALITYLSELLNLPRSAVTILHGQTGRSKVIQLQSLQAPQAQTILETSLR